MSHPIRMLTFPVFAAGWVTLKVLSWIAVVLVPVVVLLVLAGGFTVFYLGIQREVEDE